MTPKEKAEELVDKMKSVIINCDIESEFPNAKRCAIECVEEIISVCKQLGTADYKIPYWNEVLDILKPSPLLPKDLTIFDN